MLRPAPVVSQGLADLFANESDPVEPISTNQGTAPVRTAMIWQTGAHPDLKHGRLVALRNHGAFDDFSWPDDPLRPLHENTNG